MILDRTHFKIFIAFSLRRLCANYTVVHVDGIMSIFNGYCSHVSGYADVYEKRVTENKLDDDGFRNIS